MQVAIPYTFRAVVLAKNKRKEEGKWFLGELPEWVEIAEHTLEEAPIVFTVSLQNYYTREIPIKTEEIRFFNNNFWKIVYDTSYNSIPMEGIEDMPQLFARSCNMHNVHQLNGIGNFRRWEYRQISEDKENEIREKIIAQAEKYILLDGIVYVQIGEPRYAVNIRTYRNKTTCIVSTYDYDERIPRNHYFRVEEFDQAQELLQLYLRQGYQLDKETRQNIVGINPCIKTIDPQAESIPMLCAEKLREYHQLEDLIKQNESRMVELRNRQYVLVQTLFK